MTDLSRIAPNGDEEASTTHAIFNHNADKNPTQRHVKPETMRKPPRVVLA